MGKRGDYLLLRFSCEKPLQIGGSWVNLEGGSGGGAGASAYSCAELRLQAGNDPLVAVVRALRTHRSTPHTLGLKSHTLAQVVS